jgi:hypothetical protein
MVMPGKVGDRWFIEYQRLPANVLSGLFIFVVFTALAKYPLLPKKETYIEESKHFHY